MGAICSSPLSTAVQIPPISTNDAVSPLPHASHSSDAISESPTQSDFRLRPTPNDPQPSASSHPHGRSIPQHHAAVPGGSRRSSGGGGGYHRFSLESGGGVPDAEAVAAAEADALAAAEAVAVAAQQDEDEAVAAALAAVAAYTAQHQSGDFSGPPAPSRNNWRSNPLLLKLSTTATSLPFYELDDLSAFLPSTPRGDDKSTYRYMCPICFLYYRAVFKMACCGNYICNPCALSHLRVKLHDDLEEWVAVPVWNEEETTTQEGEALPVSCPACNTEGVKFKKVTGEEKPRSYVESPSTRDLLERVKRRNIILAHRASFSKIELTPSGSLHPSLPVGLTRAVSDGIYSSSTPKGGDDSESSDGVGRLPLLRPLTSVQSDKQLRAGVPGHRGRLVDFASVAENSDESDGEESLIVGGGGSGQRRRTHSVPTVAGLTGTRNSTSRTTNQNNQHTATSTALHSAASSTVSSTTQSFHPSSQMGFDLQQRHSSASPPATSHTQPHNHPHQQQLDEDELKQSPDFGFPSHLPPLPTTMSTISLPSDSSLLPSSLQPSTAHLDSIESSYSFDDSVASVGHVEAQVRLMSAASVSGSAINHVSSSSSSGAAGGGSGGDVSASPSLPLSRLQFQASATSDVIHRELASHLPGQTEAAPGIIITPSSPTAHNFTLSSSSSSSSPLLPPPSSSSILIPPLPIDFLVSRIMGPTFTNNLGEPSQRVGDASSTSSSVASSGRGEGWIVEAATQRNEESLLLQPAAPAAV